MIELDQAAAYLEKLGYTVEKQGNLEKYLVVFQKGRPLGFVLSNGSVRLVSGEKDIDRIHKVLQFLEKNSRYEIVGNGEFLIGNIMGNQMTTFYDNEEQIVRYAVYLHDENGEFNSTLFHSKEEAVYHFIMESQLIDLKTLLPRQESLMNRARSRLIGILMEQNKQAERH